ncbi:MAG: SpoIIE family protein phosphatase [Spirochaetota bacterium]
MIDQADQFSPEVKTAVDQFLQRQRKIYRINLLAAVTMRGIMLIAGAILLPLANAPFIDILNGIIAVHFIFNLAGTWAYYRMRFVEFFVISLVALDTLVLGVVSMWTGFLSSPFNLIFPMAAGVTALVAGFRASLVTAIVCTLFMGTGAVLKLQGSLPGVIAGPPLSGTMIVVHLSLLLLAEWGLAMLLAMIVSRLQKGELEQVRQAGEIAAHSSRLSGSLEEIRALKQAQDGDYFLTARLVNPFMQNAGAGSDPRVQADFLVRQKKRFAFKKWKGEIGGDYCKLDTVVLGERPFLFFVNADAMGKSLQGAGGVLVLASAFSALLERARTERENIQPEEWLGRTVGELNKLFLSFDGAMLVSLAMGLFDAATGTVYYLNLEHPRAVIVRGGEPAFFEPEMHGRKLGTAEIPMDFHLTVTRLFPGDTLLIGSDGRDDVVLETSETENGKQDKVRNINYDENRILELVRLHGTDIRALERSIEEKANLTDDLSLLSVKFVGPVSVTLDDEQYAVQLAAARQQVRAREFDAAVHALSMLVEARPDRTEGLFSLVTVLARRGDFARARQLSRRIAWREPRHAKNLLQLAALEAKAGEKVRARELAQRAAGHDSTLAEKANRLTDRL